MVLILFLCCIVCLDISGRKISGVVLHRSAPVCSTSRQLGPSIQFFKRKQSVELCYTAQLLSAQLRASFDPQFITQINIRPQYTQKVQNSNSCSCSQKTILDVFLVHLYFWLKKLVPHIPSAVRFVLFLESYQTWKGAALVLRSKLEQPTLGRIKFPWWLLTLH